MFFVILPPSMHACMHTSRSLHSRSLPLARYVPQSSAPLYTCLDAMAPHEHHLVQWLLCCPFRRFSMLTRVEVAATVAVRNLSKGPAWGAGSMPLGARDHPSTAAAVVLIAAGLEPRKSCPPARSRRTLNGLLSLLRKCLLALPRKRR